MLQEGSFGVQLLLFKSLMHRSVGQRSMVASKAEQALSSHFLRFRLAVQRSDGQFARSVSNVEQAGGFGVQLRAVVSFKQRSNGHRSS